MKVEVKIIGPFGVFSNGEGKKVPAYYVSLASKQVSVPYEGDKSPSSGSVELSCYPLCSYVHKKGEVVAYSLIPFEEEKSLGPGYHVIAVKGVDEDRMRSFTQQLIPGAFSSDRRVVMRDKEGNKRVFQKDGMTLYRLNDEEFLKLGSQGMGVSTKKDAPQEEKLPTVYVEEKISQSAIRKELEKKWEAMGINGKPQRFERARPHIGVV